MSTKEAIEQFAALFEAVKKLATIEDVDAAEQEARTKLNKSKDELNHYLAQRDRQAKEQNAAAEAELEKKVNAHETEMHTARLALEQETANGHRQVQLARDRFKTEQDVWEKGRENREQDIAGLEGTINARRNDLDEARRELSAMREQVAAEKSKLEETRAALLTLQRMLGAFPSAAA